MFMIYKKTVTASQAVNSTSSEKKRAIDKFCLGKHSVLIANFCGQNVDFLNVTACGIHSYQQFNVLSFLYILLSRSTPFITLESSYINKHSILYTQSTVDTKS